MDFRKIIRLTLLSICFFSMTFIMTSMENEVQAGGLDHLKSGKYVIEELKYSGGAINYVIVKNSKGQNLEFSGIEDAKQMMKSLPQKDSRGGIINYVIRHKNIVSPLKIAATNYGFGISWPDHKLGYGENFGKTIGIFDRHGGKISYINGGRMFRYLETAFDLDIKMQVNGVTGYIKVGQADIIPYIYIEKNVPVTYGNNRTYRLSIPMYSARSFGGPKELRFLHEDYDSYTSIGIAPSWMVENGDYYSFDGNYFYSDLAMTKRVNSEPYYNYYQYLPLTSKSKVTGAQLDAYTKERVGNKKSAMTGLGQTFVYYQQIADTNALLIYSLGVVESATGTSFLALNKSNLFGWNAVDSNPIKGASAYSSLDYAVKRQMSVSLKGYLNVDDWRFNGSYFGNKGSGFNVRYASDPYWGQTVASIAFLVDKRNGYQDLDAYQLGVLKAGQDVTVKSSPSSNSGPIKKREDDESSSGWTNFVIRGYSQNLKDQMFIIRRNSSVEAKGYYQVYLYYPELSGGDWDKDFGYIEKSKMTLVNRGKNYIPPSGLAEKPKGYDTSVKVEEVGGLKYYYVNSGPLRVRDYPSTNGSNILGSYPEKTVVQGKEVKNGWIKIKSDNILNFNEGKIEGYMFKEYLTETSKPKGENANTKASMLGDIDLNGKIENSDLLLLDEHLSNTRKLTGQALANADVNKDGKVDRVDYKAIQYHIMGIELIR